MTYNEVKTYLIGCPSWKMIKGFVRMIDLVNLEERMGHMIEERMGHMESKMEHMDNKIEERMGHIDNNMERIVKLIQNL